MGHSLNGLAPTEDDGGLAMRVISRLLCRLMGHPALKPGALFGVCRRCGEVHNHRQGWKA